MSAIPRHRAYLGFPSSISVYGLSPAEVPCWAGVAGFRRIVVILVLVVLITHGYPVPVA